MTIMRHEKFPIPKADITPMEEVSVLLQGAIQRLGNDGEDAAIMGPGLMRARGNACRESHQ